MCRFKTPRCVPAKRAHVFNSMSHQHLQWSQLLATAPVTEYVAPTAAESEASAPVVACSDRITRLQQHTTTTHTTHNTQHNNRTTHNTTTQQHTTTRHRQHTHTQVDRDLESVLTKNMSVGTPKDGELCLTRAQFLEGSWRC